VSRDEPARLWDVASGQCKAALQDSVGMLAISAGVLATSALAKADEVPPVQLWDVESGRLKATLSGGKGPVVLLALSRDGTLLAAWERWWQQWQKGDPPPADCVRLWNVASGLSQRTLQVPGGRAMQPALAFSADGRLLATGGARTPGFYHFTMHLWDVDTGQLQRTLPDTSAFAFSEQGSTLATASADGTVRVWAAACSQIQATLRGHAGWLQKLAFAPDGQTLAAASTSGTGALSVRLWDVDRGRHRAWKTIPTGPRTATNNW
jgi:WD40 repeat protein